MDLLTLYANNPNIPHDDQKASIINLNAAFIAITDFVIVLRLLARWRIVKQVAIDDYLMALAGLCTTALSTLSIVGTRYGLGRHIYDLPVATLVPNLKKVLQILWTCQFIYATSLLLVKLSIISSYLRIFPTRYIRLTMHIMAGFIVAVWLVQIFSNIFQCNPIKGTWDFEVKGTKCISFVSVYYFSTSFSILTDLLLCILPLPRVWKLKLSTKEKWILSALFGLGLFAAVASCVRIAVLHEIMNIDVTSKPVRPLNWSVTEVDTGVLCASLPWLKPLAKKFIAGRGFGIAKRPDNPGPPMNTLEGRAQAEEAAELTRMPTSPSTIPSIPKNGLSVAGTKEFV